MRKTLVGVTGLSVVILLAIATAPAALATPHHAKTTATTTKVRVIDPTIYDSTVQPNPGNMVSEAFEATATAQFGNQINFAGTARVLADVVVQLSSWGCVSGGWSTYSTAPCVTSPGSTFTEPITLNIYNVGPATAHGPSSPGALVASTTQTFAIPYRPSADTNYATDCQAEATAQNVPVSTFAGTWFDAQLNQCFNGFVTQVKFDFGHVIVPNSVIYGIAYNTSDWGAQPQRPQPCNSSSGGCGYDSLNVALSTEPTAPGPGTDAYPGTVYENVVNSGYAGNYCDAGAAGINVFRIDEPANYPTSDGSTSTCWSANSPTVQPWYIPAVQFNAVNSVSPSFTSPNAANVVAGTPFSFTVTTTGVPIPTISMLGRKLPKGLTFVNNRDGTATISGTALTTNRNKHYVVVLKAKNARNSSAKQRLVLTLTGGR
jgi:hypothetical protein